MKSDKPMTIIHPVHDRVLVERIAQEDKTESGLLYIPDNAKEKPTMGRVVAKGMECGAEFDEEEIVLFGKYSGSEISVNGREMLLIREEDILAVVEES